MDVIVERPAALDVHNASVMACVRLPGEGRRRVEHVAEFQTTVRGLLALRDWLEAHRVERVAMEATGVYWKPVWAVLEDGFDCLLVNARHVKQVPGRKTDVKDAQWLCQLLEAGLLRASLVPPKPIRTLRNLTRYRKSQIRDRQREMNRLHKVMQDTGIKLDCVATDMMGKSGRAMLDALVSGTTDPRVLADLARGQLRKKLPALQDALEGRFDAEHTLVVGRILAHIDYLDEAIDDLSSAIEAQLGPLAPAVELLCTIPGVGRRAAEVILAETGGDMTAFPSAKHLASWAACARQRRSAGKRRSGKTRKGSKWLSQTLVECAKSANPQQRPPTSLRSTAGCGHAAARTRPRSRSATRSSPPSGTCSRPARPTPTQAATSSPAATPNALASGSSTSSNASATPSPSRKGACRPQRDFLYRSSGSST